MLARSYQPLFAGYRHENSSPATAVYDPKAFFPHAVSLHQTFVHCRIFSTAATRRCTDRVSVPSLGARLSPPLPVIALVGRYPTNKLIGPRPISKRLATLPLRDHRVLPLLSEGYARLRGTYQGVTNSFATKLAIRLQLVTHSITTTTYSSEVHNEFRSTCMPYPHR